MPSIDAHALGAVALIFALGVMSPGPNFVVVAQRAVTRGRTDGLATMLGVVTVSGIWAAGSLIGIGVLFAVVPWTRDVLRVVGDVSPLAGRQDVAKRARPTRGGGRVGVWSAYRAGLATNLSYAKAIAFYTSAFSAAAPAPGQTATMWLALAPVLVIALSSGPVAAAYRRARAPIERAGGLLMIAFGAKLAVEWFRKSGCSHPGRVRASCSGAGRGAIVVRPLELLRSVVAYRRIVTGVPGFASVMGRHPKAPPADHLPILTSM